MIRPLITVIIPIFNVEKWLAQCLNSLVNQTMKDFELICINDASSDRSFEILMSYKNIFNNIIVIDKKNNEGLGYARNSGLIAATGEYVLFLDSDDLLRSDAIEIIAKEIARKEPDLLVCGVELLHEINFRDREDEKEWYRLKSKGNKVFHPNQLLQVNVEIWNKIIKLDLIKKNQIFFKKGIFEDVDFLLRVCVFFSTVSYLHEALYIYRQRSGSLMETTLTVSSERLLKGVECCFEILNFYVSKNTQECFYYVLLQFFIRNTKYAVFYAQAEKFNLIYVIAREFAQKIDKHKLNYGSLTPEDKQILYWLLKGDETEIRRSLLQNYLNIKILVSYHRPSALIKSDILQPIQLGRSIALNDGVLNSQQMSWMYENMRGDDTGDNISVKNCFLAELTAIYWARNNLSDLGNPHYIGLMHSRRHFIFDPLLSQGSGRCYDYLTKKYLEEVGLNDRNICDVIDGYDLVVPKVLILNKTVREQFDELFAEPHGLNKAYFEAALDRLIFLYPEYLDSANEYLEGNRHYRYNIFIGKTVLFIEFSDWLFSIILTIAEDVRITESKLPLQRVLTYVSESLLGIFLHHNKEKLRIKELPLAYIKDAEVGFPLKAKENVVPIVFAANDAYAKYLAVVIESIISRSNPERKYQIYVIDGGISFGNKNNISDRIKLFTNFDIDFININHYLKDEVRALFYTYNYISKETYFRFLIQDIFAEYSKVIYLDCDVIVNKDIALLYEIDISNHAIGAVRDYEVARLLKRDVGWVKYLKDDLMIENQDAYFQAGVLLINVDRMRKIDGFGRLVSQLQKTPSPRFVDQDILNAALQNEVKIIDPRWNFLWSIEEYDPDFKMVVDKNTYDEYCASKNNHYLIHYNGSKKPWHSNDARYAWLFWVSARSSVFYEELLYELHYFKNSRNESDIIPLSSKEGLIFLTFRQLKLMNVSFVTHKMINFFVVYLKVIWRILPATIRLGLTPYVNMLRSLKGKILDN